MADNLGFDNCESLGETIQLDGVSVDQYSIKRNEQVNSLPSIKGGVVAQVKLIDPSVLFNRLTVLIKQEEKGMEMFKCESTLDPAALFK